METYDELVHAIREARAASRTRIDQAIDQEKVREAWEIGKLIDEHVLLHKERADYGERVLQRLSTDLGISHTELKYMLQFARAYPIGRPADQLSWSHYQALLSLNNPKQREEIADKAEREDWGRDRVREEVARLNHRQISTNEILEAKPGKLHTYRVVKALYGPLTGQLVLDLGFSDYFQPEKISKFKEGDVIQIHSSLRGNTPSRAAPGPTGRRARREAISVLENASLSDLYTYRVYVTQVIDGDTFRAVIDLGFKIFSVQTLRLRGLDAPEIESAQGREAKTFLAQKLEKSPVLIRTQKSDKYDRYLADVFVEDQYINQELISHGLATIAQDS